MLRRSKSHRKVLMGGKKSRSEPAWHSSPVLVLRSTLKRFETCPIVSPLGHFAQPENPYGLKWRLRVRPCALPVARGGSAEEGRGLWSGVADCRVWGGALAEGVVVHQGGNEEGTWLLVVAAPTLEEQARKKTRCHYWKLFSEQHDEKQIFTWSRGRTPGTPWRVELRWWRSIGAPARKRTVHGAGSGSWRQWADHAWIGFR